MQPEIQFEDTIAAIATAHGEGGIGIIRISGQAAAGIARAVFQGPGGKKPPALRSHSVVYGYVVDPVSGERLDEALMIYMAAPRSFTREDVVELHCHGGAVATARVLDAVVSAGARVAEPGEFTKRAFLSGRIDLSQAEAALDIIRARTEAAERLALSQLEGALSLKVGQIRDTLVGICAHVEAHLDFPEEDIEPEASEKILAAIREAEIVTRALAESFSEGRLYREGVRTAIVGRPNVGKSSLLNLLLEQDRAIVTSAPGTTRDVIEETLNIKGLPVVVMDTAGIRESHDMAESEGVRRSLKALQEADLVLAVFDSSCPLHPEDHMVLEKIEGKNSIIALNKSDLPSEGQEGVFEGLNTVKVSAKKAKGLEALKDAIHDAALRGTPGKGGGGQAEGMVITNKRHKEALVKTHKALGNALARLEEKAPLEVPALELREALDSLGEIVGKVSTEEILDRIFSEFCIGK
ncbi:MAG: tRNA uridine-5-carboxymethylaminomethyl(34) synthesis GTPase MnmE [Thermodesulfovibrionales bacterium]|nr:tRNA uridine-5-carboxymethylaminomethyl(34) synthesis GTPase MnmE [Thermodesulfovibrionales bacterium]